MLATYMYKSTFSFIIMFYFSNNNIHFRIVTVRGQCGMIDNGIWYCVARILYDRPAYASTVRIGNELYVCVVRRMKSCAHRVRYGCLVLMFSKWNEIIDMKAYLCILP